MISAASIRPFFFFMPALASVVDTSPESATLCPRIDATSMKEELMRRLLNLVEKTGDKVVVTDPAGEHPYVLMNLEQYEGLALDKAAPAASAAPTPPKPPVKREIPLWKPPEPPKTAAAPRFKPPIPPPEDVGMVLEDEEQFYLEPLE